MQPEIICFGETLFDVLPDGAVPGGAPMNVAIHLQYHSHSPLVISRVGKDSAGIELIRFLQEKGLTTEHIQQDEIHQTGLVVADVSNKTQVVYNIVEQVAWDYISYDENLAAIVKESEVFIYGSFASRNKISREALLKYLPKAKLKIFDVNLRAPHYTPEGIRELLAYADIIKMNHHELAEISAWYGVSLNEKESMQYLRKQLNKKMLMVTRGRKRCSLHN